MKELHQRRRSSKWNKNYENDHWPLASEIIRPYFKENIYFLFEGNHKAAHIWIPIKAWNIVGVFHVGAILHSTAFVQKSTNDDVKTNQRGKQRIRFL